MGEEMRLLASLLPPRLPIPTHARFGYSNHPHFLPRDERRRAHNIRFLSPFDGRMSDDEPGTMSRAAGDESSFGLVGGLELRRRGLGGGFNHLAGEGLKLEGVRCAEGNARDNTMGSGMFSNSGNQEPRKTKVGTYFGGQDRTGEGAGSNNNSSRDGRYVNLAGSQQRGRAAETDQRWRNGDRWSTGKWPGNGGAGRWRERIENSDRGGRGAWIRHSNMYGDAPTDDGEECRRESRVSRSRRGFEEYRYWCNADKELPTPLEKFVLVSYNILADKNAFQHMSELYHMPWGLLRWDRRMPNILAELGEWSADIMCLQEVDMFEDLQLQLGGRGYRGVYTGRTGGARDGCAIFWRTSRFRLLQEESILFNEFGLRDNVAQLCVFQSITNEADEETNTMAQFPNSGSSIGPGNLIIVGNIHVLFNPKRGDVKLGQVRILLESAHKLSEKWGGIPVTIAGDFNSTPQSDLYRFLATSELDISGLNRATMSGQEAAGEGAPFSWMSNNAQQQTFSDRYPPEFAWKNQQERRFDPPASVTAIRTQTTMSKSSNSGSLDDQTLQMEIVGTCPPATENFLGNPSGRKTPNKFVKRSSWTREELMAATGTPDCLTLQHNLNLRSAYSQIKGEDGCRDPNGEPLVTTFHRKFMGTVDYIWHTEGIDTLKVLDTLPVNILKRTAGLPTRKWGSDHLALACELALLQSTNPK